MTRPAKIHRIQAAALRRENPLGKPPRRHDLDWLRILVVLNLIPFHTAWMMVTVKGFSYIPPAAFGTALLKGYLAFVREWQVPLLFFISGVGSGFALRFRSTAEYAGERLKRLAFPLLFFMMVTFPLIGYFWHGSVAEKSFADYLFRYWPYNLKMSYNAILAQKVHWAHMWFVAYLLAFTFLALPLFHFLRNREQRQPMSGWTALFKRNGALFWPAVPLVVIWAALSIRWPVLPLGRTINHDWAYFCYNLGLFIYGYVFCLDERFWQAVDRHFKISLLLALVCAVSLPALQFRPLFSTPSYTFQYLAFSALKVFNTWCWIVAVLGLARRFVSGASGFLDYFRAASYPFYILHVVPMVIIGPYVTQWRIGVIAEFLTISILSFLATLGGYEILKHTLPTRFMFGMKK